MKGWTNFQIRVETYEKLKEIQKMMEEDLDDKIPLWKIIELLIDFWKPEVKKNDFVYTCKG
ncbi:MAG: hypothetical protein DRP09_12880 [Candidatus Thorarchaeota archaeon]|nr:MAG: hypothetical protein DRP09_12880 [Candidatus Thorarchaeota archaeon]